jgi:hypothetical protein
MLLLFGPKTQTAFQQRNRSIIMAELETPTIQQHSDDRQKRINKKTKAKNDGGVRLSGEEVEIVSKLVVEVEKHRKKERKKEQNKKIKKNSKNKTKNVQNNTNVK